MKSEILRYFKNLFIHDNMIFSRKLTGEFWDFCCHHIQYTAKFDFN